MNASLRLGMAGNAMRKRRKRLDGTSGKFCGYRAARCCDHCHVQRTRSTYRTINTFADVCSLRRSCANPGDARPASKVPGCVSATSHYDDVVAAAPHHHHHQQQQQQQQHLAAAVCRQPQCTACDRVYGHHTITRHHALS